MAVSVKSESGLKEVHMRNWTPEIINAFAKYDDLLREAEYDRRVHPAREPRVGLSVSRAAKQAVCRIQPVRATRLCLVPSAV